MRKAFNIFRSSSFAPLAAETGALPFSSKGQTLHAFFDQMTESLNEKTTETSSRLRNRMSNFQFNNRRTKNLLKKSLRFIVPLLFLIVLVLVVRIVIKSATASKQTTADAQLTLQTPKATENINKTLSFTLKDSNGKDAGSFNYTIQSADVQDQIIVQGKPVNAVAGREFLIINLKLTNGLNKGIQINTRDYIRLSTNNDQKDWLAPEIHNDPVEVQAISTQFTRVGFPIYTTDKKLLLQVGEINGKKIRIPLTVQ